MHNIRKPALTPLAAALATLLAFPALAETSADVAATAAAAEREPTDRCVVFPDAGRTQNDRRRTPAASAVEVRRDSTDTAFETQTAHGYRQRVQARIRALIAEEKNRLGTDFRSQ